MSRKTPTYNFVLYQGATFNLPLTWKDAAGLAIDVTGYTAQLTARENVVTDPALIDMTDANSQIIVGTTDGKFTLQLTATETAALSFDKAKYQMEVTDGAGFVTRLLSGTITLSEELVV